MSDVKHTPGYCRIERWREEDMQADLRMGMSSPDADDWRYAGWTDFRSEVDAREFVKRWNCHEQLLAACKEAVESGCGSHTGECGWWDTRIKGGLYHHDGICDCYLSRLEAAIAAASQP